MKDITIIVPLNEVNDTILDYMETALKSVDDNQKFYEDKLKVMVVCINDDDKKLIQTRFDKRTIDYVINNTNETDFCSQINTAAKLIDTEYFSILEFDDYYGNKWFKSVKEYFYSHEDVSLFLPINTQRDLTNNLCQFVNELAWSNEFSKEIGFIDKNGLDDFYGFNLTGGVFNTQDFNRIGGFNTSIRVAFNYELLLRLLNEKMKIYVVPKEGYVHLINREGSLTDFYMKTLTKEEIRECFSNAIKEVNAISLNKE